MAEQKARSSPARWFGPILAMIDKTVVKDSQ